MTAPDVTITVIAYNDADRLPRAVESLLRQTHPHIEIIISDDHSTDETPRVARALAAADERVRYVRLPSNSGGCSAPRNRAIELAHAPYLMFLDSDDELPPRSVELLLAAHAEREVDFVMGAVERVRVDTGRTSTWMPHLVATRRTVEGIASEPALLFEHLSTSKMYRKSFLDRNGLRFPEGIHYEDQLFSAQAYCLARAFTVIPDPVYRWYIEPYATGPSASISNQRHKLSNVRDRVHVQGLIDDFLAASGHAGLREAKDYKFLKHDFRMYAGDVPYRDEEWLRGFAEIVNPYLAGLSQAAYERLPRAERVVLQLIRDGRLADARLAARGLGHGVAPREVTAGPDGRLYWGDRVPESASSRHELDVTDLGLDTRPFAGAQFRHEITRIERGGGAALRLTIRTYDPGLRLPVGPQVARVVVAPGRTRLTVPFRLDPVRPGVFEGEAVLDPTQAHLPLTGFEGTRHPLIRLTLGQLHNSGLLLAPLTFPRLTAHVNYHAGLTPHVVTAEPEGRGTGRLQLTWTPVGPTTRVLRPASRHLTGPRTTRLRQAARLAAKALR
ncbi:glycosyltransferase family 2 protein [Streptomyces sp. NPDC059063]|uniref:glycosyltransferase family 2 protein n=1 Tax=unclassified Streptomyces TaxID=2593676 RepID=UPI00369722DF